MERGDCQQRGSGIIPFPMRESSSGKTIAYPAINVGSIPFFPLNAKRYFGFCTCHAVSGTPVTASAVAMLVPLGPISQT